MFSLSNMPSTASVLSTYTTLAASAMLVKTILSEVRNLINQLIPQRLQVIIFAKFEGLMGKYTTETSQMTLVIDESNGGLPNQMFGASQVYLRTKISPSVAKLKVYKGPEDNNFSITINGGEKIEDTFEDIQLIWQIICPDPQKKRTSRKDRSFELCFHKKYREEVLNTYLPYVLKTSKAIEEENKVVKLYSLDEECDVNLDHPSTFNTLAMDPELKKELIDDLDRFVKRREFYKRVGKAWKRGYLLYGPPGTGKSSLIAAMANYLKFHIYELQLTSLYSNSQLRTVLLSTSNRSILVIEDIDCSHDFQNREDGGFNHGNSQLTLSGLLNFLDGLWSSCGDERIIVFTTNHKERLDPALLRPGRMDMHIHMSYCTPQGFKILASNYLRINNHSMFSEIEQLIKEVEVTPAQIAEGLMKSGEPDIALKGLIKYLHLKRAELGKAREKNEVNEQAKETQEVKEEAENKGGSFKEYL